MKKKHRHHGERHKSETWERSLIVPPDRAETAQTVSWWTYDESECEHKSLGQGAPEKLLAAIPPQETVRGNLWVNVDGIGDAKFVELLCRRYDIHPLIVEDMLTVNQRPKFEDFGNYLSIVMKMFELKMDPESGEEMVTSEQLSLILGKGYLLTIQEKTGGDLFGSIRTALQYKRGKIRSLPVSHLAYQIIDAVVDNYFVILDSLSEKIELLEDETMGNPTEGTIARIQALRNTVILLRKSVWPLREVLDRLEHGIGTIIDETTLIYLRDVYDHSVQIMDQLDVLRDIIAGILEIYLSNASYKLNTVLKRLTVITTIFMPLSVLAGIGGMSEWSMMTGPEHWRLSYPLFLAGLGVIGFFTYLFFKMKKWV